MHHIAPLPAPSTDDVLEQLRAEVVAIRNDLAIVLEALAPYVVRRRPDLRLVSEQAGGDR
jgi:hypothetical protein